MKSAIHYITILYIYIYIYISVYMSNNKITNLGNATRGKNGVSRDYGDGRYVKKGRDTMTGALSVPDLNFSLG